MVHCPFLDRKDCARGPVHFQVDSNPATTANWSATIDVASIEKAFIGYRPLRVLQFVRESDGEPLVHVYDGVERSVRHEMVVLEMEQNQLHALRVERKPKAVPSTIEDPAAQLLGKNAYDAAWRLFRELPQLKESIRDREERLTQDAVVSQEPTDVSPVGEGEPSGDLRAEVERLQDRIKELSSDTASSEILSMAQHRPRLLQALSEAKNRIIIISPWLTPTAVNYELREAIGQCLRRGVDVWIGYGFGEADKQEDATLRKLEYLRSQPGGNKLKLKRLNDSHAKVIVCDDRFMITTSFNWLSFAGREDWGNRIEFGTLTRNPGAVQKMLLQLEPLFETTFVATPPPVNAASSAP